MGTPYGSRVESHCVAQTVLSPLLGVSFYDCVVLVRRFPLSSCGTRSAAAYGGGGIERGAVIGSSDNCLVPVLLAEQHAETVLLIVLFFNEVVNYVALYS